MKTESELIDKMLREGGAIVGSGSCDPVEIAIARACGLFALRGDYGLVLKPKGWVAAAKEGIAARLAEVAMRTEPVAGDSLPFAFTPEQLVVRLRCFADGAEFEQDEWRQCLFGQAADTIERLVRDCARLDSGEIVLTVSGERVHHRGVNLRAAIDAGVEESLPNSD